jgi:hypothetical protein
VNITALAAEGGGSIPIARPNSGENVMRMPTTYQIGTPTRMMARYRRARSRVAKSCRNLPRACASAFTCWNRPDSWTPMRSSSSAMPMMPPTVYATRQSNTSPMTTAAIAPQIPTAATTAVA